MYFIEQLKNQCISSIFSNLVEQGAGLEPTEKVDKPQEVAKTPADKMEVADAATKLGNKVDQKSNDFKKQQQNIQDSLDGKKEKPSEVNVNAETVSETSEQNPKQILENTPASEAERYAARAAVREAGGEITDEAIDAAIVEARGESGDVRELTQEEQTEANKEALTTAAADVGIHPDTLQQFYEYTNTESPDGKPKTVKDMVTFANEMEKFKILLEKNGQELPKTEEEFKEMYAKMVDEDGTFKIPLTQEEAEAMGFVFNEDGTLDVSQTPDYASSDAGTGKPYVSNGQVQSGYRGGASYEGGGRALDLNNLPPGPDGLTKLIVQAEARGNYNIIYGGCPIQPPKPITEMTVREVSDFQDRMVASGSASSAVGGIQIIRKTLDPYVEKYPNEKFTEEFQNKLITAKMEERGLSKYTSGAIDEMTFMRNLSQEWASMPKDMGGASYYAGDGLNHALVSPQQLLKQIRTIRGSSASNSEVV